MTMELQIAHDLLLSEIGPSAKIQVTLLTHNPSTLYTVFEILNWNGSNISGAIAKACELCFDIPTSGVGISGSFDPRHDLLQRIRNILPGLSEIPVSQIRVADDHNHLRPPLQK